MGLNFNFTYRPEPFLIAASEPFRQSTHIEFAIFEFTRRLHNFTLIMCHAVFTETIRNGMKMQYITFLLKMYYYDKNHYIHSTCTLIKLLTGSISTCVHEHSIRLN